jgi:uncharacterized protein YijF (DUF1287 family)
MGALLLGPLLALSWVGLAAAETADRGIFPELDAQVPLVSERVPPALGPAARLRIDDARGLATLYADDDPLALFAYPLAPALRAALPVGLREIRGAPDRDEDHDGDGIVDRLDMLRGAKKLLLNKAAYHARYVALRYPGGDVPRTEGVCTDTIIRALRNAGIDLQRALHEDLLAARRAYPMVDKVDPNINHRRVKVILRWFERHTRRVATGEDYQPGDVLFFDTFPNKPGAEHVGIVSDRRAPDGNYLVINNWTDGAVDAEMALVSAVPVTDHFRLGQPAVR